jgi:hypothetical protein
MRRNNQRKKNVRNRGYNQDPTNAITTVQSPRFGFINPRCLSTFKYITVVNFTVATTVGAQHVFKANGMFDPDTTGSGHQPYGFDQMLNIYQRYCVLRTKYRVSFAPSNDRLMVGTIVASTVTTTVADLATFSLAAESPHAQTKAMSFAGGPPAVFTGSIATNAILGTTREQMIADDLFQGTTTTDPTNLTVLTVYWYNPSTGSVTSSFMIELEYEAMLFDPYLQNQS